jgi:hypothetical protein
LSTKQRQSEHWADRAMLAAIGLLPSSIARADVFNMPNGQTR